MCMHVPKLMCHRKAYEPRRSCATEKQMNPDVDVPVVV